MIINEIGRAPVGNQDIRLLVPIQISNDQVAGVLGDRTNGRAIDELTIFLPEIDAALLPVIGNGHIQ